MFLFKFVLNDRSIQKSFERIEQFESAMNGVTIIESLSNHRSESSLQLFDLRSELIKIVIELFVLNVHNVVIQGLELVHSFLEFHEDLLQSFSQGFTLGTSEFNLSQLVELHDGVSQMQNVVASFKEGIQSHKQSIGGQLPSVLSFGFILEISIFELSTHINCGGQFFTGFISFFAGNQLENGGSGHVFFGLGDDGVADLSDQDHKSGRSVVISGLLPDKEDQMHDWDVQVMSDLKLLRVVAQLLEPRSQGVQVFEIVVGFDSGVHHFFLQLRERVGVCAFISFQETEDILNFVGFQLLVDGIEIVSLLLPEFEFGERSWVVALLQSLFRFQFQNIFDLFGPGDDGTFKNVCFVFIGSRLGCD